MLLDPLRRLTGPLLQPAGKVVHLLEDVVVRRGGLLDVVVHMTNASGSSTRNRLRRFCSGQVVLTALEALGPCGTGDVAEERGVDAPAVETRAHAFLPRRAARLDVRGPNEEVDLVLLSHDEVLYEVLQCLRARLLARFGDDRVQRSQRFLLDADEVLEAVLNGGLVGDGGDLDPGADRRARRSWR
jgi:hypothetical protein